MRRIRLVADTLIDTPIAGTAANAWAAQGWR